MTHWIVAGFLVFAAAVAALSLYARLRPLNPAIYHRADDIRPAGEWPDDGGFEVVRPVSDGEAALSKLADVIERSPRTTPLAGSVAEHHLSYVTRTSLMGFPDITNLWVRDGLLHIRGHLVIGRSDMGVNERRVRGWMQQAGLS